MDGKPYTVRYEAVDGMLLNEFLEEHRKVEEQGRRLEQQDAAIARQQRQIEALAAALQEVSAQTEQPRTANGFEQSVKTRALPLFEIARVLVRFDQVASRIGNANHGIG